jgi:hypothetical protein
MASVDEFKEVCALIAKIDAMTNRLGRVDMSGFRSGRLTVMCRSSVKEKKNPSTAKYKWLCLCDCGNRCFVDRDQLRRGQQSCGCVQPLVTRAVALARGRERCKCGAEVEVNMFDKMPWNKYRGGRLCMNCLRGAQRRYKEKRVADMTDSYIADLLNMRVQATPQELIDAKREHLKVNRLLKEKFSEPV